MTQCGYCGREVSEPYNRIVTVTNLKASILIDNVERPITMENEKFCNVECLATALKELAWQLRCGMLEDKYDA
jgi:hypothetical protein